MIVSSLTIKLENFHQKLLTYGNFRNLGNTAFVSSWLPTLPKQSKKSLGKTPDVFLNCVSKLQLTYFSKLKNKYFKNNELSKAFMNENTFSNKFSKKPKPQKKSLFNCQRNLPVTLLWKTKKIHFGNINEKDVTDNNFFGNLSNHSNWIK